MQAGPGGELLVDRDATLVAGVQALSGAEAGRGRVFVVSGPAGIGKSSVLAALVERARTGGMRVLRARASPVEADFAFGVLRQLADPVLRQTSRSGGLLQDVPVTALAVLGVPGATAEPVHDPLPTVLHGLHWLVSNLATTQPLVLVVDDVQWSDAPSLMFVEYLARRIGDSPVAVLLGLRVPDPDGEQAHAAVVRMVAAGDAVQSSLSGLSPRAAAVLAERRFGRPADEEFVTACHAATGGNPFLLCALLDDVARTGAAPSRQVASTLHTLLPEVVCRDVLVRLHRLPQELRAVAEAVAVLGGHASVRSAAAVAGQAVPATEEAADALAGAGLLNAGRPLDFVHPLLRQAVYSDVPPGRRSRLHRVAARELVRRGAASGQAAAHLLQVEAGDDEWACTVLRRAAADASGAGLPATAVLYLQRALDEAPAAERGVILLELGLAQAHAALPACTETLAAALTEGVAAERRSEVSLALARALWYLTGDAAAALRVLDDVDTASLDPDTGLRVAAQRVELRVGWVDGLGGLGADEQARAAAELEVLAPSARPPRPESAVVLGTLARRALEQGEPSATAAALARDAIAAGPESLLYSSGPDVLVWAEDYATAARVLDDLLDDAARSGSAYAFGVASLWRGVLGFRLGRLVDAEADCRACVDLMADLGVHGLSYPAAFLAEVLLERDIEAAEAVLAGVPASPGGGFSEFYLHVRGRLRAAQGRFIEAVEDLTAAGARATSPAILPWRSSAARVLVQTGERAAAVDLAREEVDLTSEQGGPRAQAVALAALGRALGPGEGVSVLEAALAALDDSPAQLVRAGVLADLGRFHRLARRIPQAREALRVALELADACGARLLAEEVRSELVASGVRPRRAATTGVAALTASERRVAELAVSGKSNRDIAHALFVSPWTVASHLTRVYQKLGVPGREQLGEVLGSAARPPAARSYGPAEP